MTADEVDRPSATHQSPLAPIVGANRFSPLGERHRQQRALLCPLPRQAVANHQAAIDRAAGAD